MNSLRDEGLRGAAATVGRVASSWWRTRGKQAPVRTPVSADSVLNLEPGELVVVKDLDEILLTLDANGKNRGLVFTPEMRKHCGKRYRVFKRLELMFDEYHKSQRKVRNTVLLENVFCEGAGLGCHRSCFHYWREAWLHRVDSRTPPTTTG